MRSASVSAVFALLVMLLLGCDPSGADARQLVTAARRLQQTAASLSQIVSFTPKPITGVEAVADQAVSGQAVGQAAGPAILPNFGIPTPAPVVPVVVPPIVLAPDPAPVLNATVVWDAPWACGEAATDCRTRDELATVGATASFDVTVGAGSINDMIIIANSSDGHVDL